MLAILLRNRVNNEEAWTKPVFVIPFLVNESGQCEIIWISDKNQFLYGYFLMGILYHKSYFSNIKTTTAYIFETN